MGLRVVGELGGWAYRWGRVGLEWRLGWGVGEFRMDTWPLSLKADTQSNEGS